ncbi:MAG: aldehyde ferredoxin oxidoreductase family protein [Candidatus Lokiarchaeota archaeon]|nr:aldehyde ferredoxin oxidoreductase family protein [Candidatus Lokiarchaeota archaeon]
MYSLMHGWHGKLLRVDLSKAKAQTEPIPKAILSSYIGGRGIGVRYLADEVPPEADPLGPGNKIVLATGPLNGTTVPVTGRYAAVSKSPLTGTVFDCNSGGSFGVYLKYCGFDAVIIEGKSPEPVYLHLTPEGASIEGAKGLRGKGVKATTDALREKHGKSARVSCIGPAGENLVLFANIENDYHHALGRGGLGAVLGSKNLKAVVVDAGEKAAQVPTSVAHPDALKVIVQEINKRIQASPMTGKGLKIFGTAQLVNLMNAMGIFPINNFQQGTHPEADKISGDAIIEQIFQSNTACHMCPIACGKLTRTGTGEGKGPEYESVWALGADCGIFDLEAVTNANYACNELGLDTITAGATIACAMELNERGKLPAAWKGVDFGNKDVLLPLIEKIVARDGIGADLALGSKRLAAKYGAPELAMQVKGLEMPAYDPRGALGMALAYATSNRGACHLRAYTVGAELLGLPKIFDRFSFSDKPDLVVKLQNGNAFFDSIVACKFTGMGVPDDYYSRAVSAVTGLEITITEAEHIGERIWNLERLYNNAAGLGRADDALPPRFQNPLQSGASKGHVPPMDIMLNMFYEIRGWTDEGVPRPGTLQRLGLKPLSKEA